MARGGLTMGTIGKAKQKAAKAKAKAKNKINAKKGKCK